MSMNWQTPKPLFNALNRAVGFAVDAAADDKTHLLPLWYGPGSPLVGHQDALKVPVWDSPAFLNPPYLKGKAWEQWLDKILEQKALGVRIVALLPAKTGTDWWFDYVVLPRADIMFLKGRVPFELAGRAKPTQPNHDSAIVIYHQETTGVVTWMDWKPTVMEGSVAPEGGGESKPGLIIMPQDLATYKVHDPKTGATHRVLKPKKAKDMP